MVPALTTLGVLVALALAVWAGTRMVRAGGGATSNGGNAFGGFDVFDPGRERAQDDLESQKHQSVVTPTPDDDDRPIRLDTDTNSVRVRRPSPPSPSRVPPPPAADPEPTDETATGQ